MKSKKIETFATYLLLLSPILQTYGWGKFDFAFILTSILAIYCLFSGLLKTNLVPKYLSMYIVYWLFIHLISSSDITDALSFGAIKAFCVYAMFFNIIRLDKLLKIYKKIVWICIFFFYIQFFALSFFSFKIFGVIPFLPLTLNVDSGATYFSLFATINRPSSFFSEPAHFAQFLIPYICIVLFKRNISIKSKILDFIYVSSALILLQSGNALLGLAIVLVSYLVFLFKSGGRSVFYIPIMIIFMGVISLIFINTHIGENILLRQTQITANSYEQLGYSTSGFERIYRGYYVYEQYSPISKIFGNDNPIYKINAAQQSEVSGSFLENDMYFNTFQSFLLNTGLIGVILFILLCRGLWRTSNNCGKSIIFSFILLGLVSSLYFSETMCLYLIVPYLMKNKDHKLLNSYH